MSAATARAEEASGVGVVEMDDRTIFRGDLHHFVELGDDAVHREHAVGGHQLEARALGVGGLELGFEVGDVVVGVAEAHRLAEAHAVDDRGVVELVGDHRVLFGQQHFEEPAVGIEARRVEDGVLGAEELRNLLLEAAVERLGAADEAHAGHPKPPAAQRLARRLYDLRVVGETEVVVGAHVDDLPTVGQGHRGILAGVDEPLALVEPGGVDFTESGLNVGKEIF